MPGTAAGLGYGTASALAKALTGRFAEGLGAVLTSWELYALAAAGLLGLATSQAALRSRALAPAMAVTNSVLLLAGVVLGFTVLGESFAHGPGHPVSVAAGLATATVGIALLSRAPASAATGPPPSPVARV